MSFHEIMVVWLIGAGKMAIEYFKILNDLELEIIVIGNSDTTNNIFKDKTGHSPISGGLSQFLKNNPEFPAHVINCVSIVSLFETTQLLLDYGIKAMLIEKPGAEDFSQAEKVLEIAKIHNARIFIAYNRRFYQSTLFVKKLIENGKSIASLNFEFTEWSHQIVKLEVPDKVKENWFFANSTHLIDMSFFLSGKPTTLISLVSGSLDWHPSASKFSGTGKVGNNTLFSYIADWESPGRWGLDIIVDKVRYIFKPLEKLQKQEIGSINIDFVEIDYTLDQKYKPGLYLLVQALLDENNELRKYLKTLEEQIADIRGIYQPILIGNIQ